jgi:aspartate racemase
MSYAGNYPARIQKDYLRVIQTMADGGAGGIILGCTEIELLVKPTDFSLPLFPTTKIHAQAAVELALA